MRGDALAPPFVTRFFLGDLLIRHHHRFAGHFLRQPQVKSAPSPQAAPLSHSDDPSVGCGGSKPVAKFCFCPEPVLVR
jgi:hypothetical protein